jgi:type II secretory pathway component GspD/PulD (secretin)
MPIRGRAGLLGLTTLVCLALAGGPPVDGQQPKGGDAKDKRFVYQVKHGSARELALVLGKFYAKNEAEIQPVLEGGANALLISAAPGVFDDLVATLKELDRKPHTVMVDVWLLEIVPRKNKDGDLQMPTIDDKGGGGPADQIPNAIKALEKGGFLARAQHFQLSAVENQTANLSQVENKPYVTSVSGFGGKGGARALSYKTVGTTLSATPRLGADKLVIVDLRLEDSRMTAPGTGIVLGMDDQGVPIHATEFLTTTVNGKLSVPSGHAVVAEGTETAGKAGMGRTLVIVGARVVP